ncbi:MAG: hypothetical protein M1833_006561 [Piccolia ochrophora]|nr:MAG: hypothetical protein M1833_006561 [Piccolia ochrophora]
MAVDDHTQMEWKEQRSPLYSQASLARLPGAQSIKTPPTTPPISEDDPEDENVLSTAVHVLSTEATALSKLARLYQTDAAARKGFSEAVKAIAHSYQSGGKVVISGVGKSGKICHKLVATMNSLGILCMFLHPTEALHGDLGMIRPNDTVALVTFSGQTTELRALMPHISPALPIIVLTSHSDPNTVPLTSHRPDSIILPTPIPESEQSSFGVAAPTTSTTVALALGDALAVAVARKVHIAEGRNSGEVFRSYHPGGAIGMQ